MSADAEFAVRNWYTPLTQRTTELRTHSHRAQSSLLRHVTTHVSGHTDEITVPVRAGFGFGVCGCGRGAPQRPAERRPQDESHQVPSLHTGISFTLSSSHMTHGSRDQSFPASACALTGRSRSNSGGTRPKAHKRGRARVAYGSNLADTPRLPPRTSQIHLPRLTFTYISRSLSLSCLHATSSSPRPSLP